LEEKKVEFLTFPQQILRTYTPLATRKEAKELKGDDASTLDYLNKRSHSCFPPLTTQPGIALIKDWQIAELHLKFLK
jgi:SET domain-containing protein